MKSKMNIIAKKERKIVFLDKIIITEKSCVSKVTMTTA